MLTQNRQIIFLLLLLPMVFSCDKIASSNNENTGQSESHLVGQTIGTNGGTITVNQALTIVIPPNTFDGPYPLEIFLFTGNTAGPNSAYTIKGLPVFYYDSIQIRLIVPNLTAKISNSSLENAAGSFIAAGTKFTSDSLGVSSPSRLFKANEEGDTLVATLPPTTTDTSLANDGTETQTLKLEALKGISSVLSTGGHFEIFFPESQIVNLSAGEQLGIYLEGAYQTFDSMGFSYQKRTNWPMQIIVKSLETSKFGVYENSIWGHNHGTIEFNSNKLTDLKELRVTAGHEFFHMVQSFYDPRNFYSRAKFEPPHHWLNEASSVWAEGFFTDETNYLSPARTGNEEEPFTGVEKGIELSTATAHGYGMAPLIKYLADNFSQETIVDVYIRIENDIPPVRALDGATTESIATWWEKFLRSYVSGSIYPLNVSFIEGIRTELAVIDADSMSMVYSSLYPDLSGQIYVIRLTNQYFDSTTSMSLSVTGSFSDISVFKYHRLNNTIEFLAHSLESVRVNGLKTLVNEGMNIIALVSNSRTQAPYTGNSNIDLSINVNKTAAIPPAQYISSTFDFNDEGWLITPRADNFGDITGAGSPLYNAPDGTPYQYIAHQDLGPGTYWFFRAPTKFYGDRSGLYGKKLVFDLKQTNPEPNAGLAPFVILRGGGYNLYLYDTDLTKPDTTWKTYSYALDVSAGWRLNSGWSTASTLATQSDIIAVLTTLTDMRIRGEFTDGADQGYLDNVGLGAD